MTHCYHTIKPRIAGGWLFVVGPPYKYTCDETIHLSHERKYMKFVHLERFDVAVNRIKSLMITSLIKELRRGIVFGLSWNESTGIWNDIQTKSISNYFHHRFLAICRAARLNAECVAVLCHLISWNLIFSGRNKYFDNRTHHSNSTITNFRVIVSRFRHWKIQFQCWLQALFRVKQKRKKIFKSVFSLFVFRSGLHEIGLVYELKFCRRRMCVIAKYSHVIISFQVHANRLFSSYFLLRPQPWIDANKSAESEREREWDVDKTEIKSE